MAVAGLNEVIQSYIMRRNSINQDLTDYSSQKTLSSYRTSDLASWKNTRTSAIKAEYKNIFENQYDNDNYDYVDYSELPEYQDEVSYVDSYYEAQSEDLTTWEVMLDNQITTMNVELNEVTAYVDSFKQMLSNNIKSDFDYGGM